jgi:peptidoglycan/LPS O-acetylase OafA/YrhL
MRLTQLDSVRAIAIALVMVEHYGGKGLNAHLPIGMGSMGVGCFFALSGFLITSSLLVDRDTYGGQSLTYYKNFYIRRMLRLMPAYYLWIAVLCLFAIEPVAESWLWHVTYLSNVWISLGNPLLDFWSLSVEEQFYLFWPLVIALTPRRHLMPVILGTTVVGSFAFKAAWEFYGHSGATIKSLLVSNMTELGLGSALALFCYRNGKPYNFTWYDTKTHRVFSIISLACLATATLCWYLVGKEGPYRYYINDLVCAVPFVWLILNASIGFKGRFGTFMSNSSVQYVGKISYGLYLTHNFVPKILVKEFGPMPRWELGVASIAITFMICSLSWRFIEKPILSLKRYFEPRAKLPPEDRASEPAVRPIAGGSPIAGSSSPTEISDSSPMETAALSGAIVRP